MKLQSTVGALCALLALSGCGTARPPAAVAPNLPARWHAPLPAPVAHGGSAAELSDWWRRLDDPLLVELIGAAQTASPDLAAAAARIEEARAARVAAGAALLPRLDGSASASRSNSATFGGSAPTASASGAGTGAAVASTGTAAASAAIPVTTAQLGVQAQWEIDLFGRLRANREAGDLRLAAAEARWHDARVAVAAETANAYFGERACRAQLAVSESDARSRSETARLNDLSARAGFTAPADAALARAGAADASARLTQQRAQCELQRKGLVALTGLQEPELRRRLESLAGPRDLPSVAPIDALPAAVLAQRPDVFAAEQAVAAASAEVGAAQAERYPRLSLSGTVGRVQLRAAGFGQSLDTWTIGPVALTVPLFDGGTIAANAEAARARYEESVSAYRASVRRAVREVEEALVNLWSTDARAGDAELAVRSYQASFDATQARRESGLASLFELEDSRRTLFAAQTAQVSLQRERAQAWVALYRAAGGGWTAPDGGLSTSADVSVSPSPARAPSSSSSPSFSSAATPMSASASAPSPPSFRSPDRSPSAAGPSPSVPTP